MVNLVLPLISLHLLIRMLFFSLKFGWSFTGYFLVNFEILVAVIRHFISDFFVQYFGFWFHKFLCVWPLSSKYLSLNMCDKKVWIYMDLEFRLIWCGANVCSVIRVILLRKVVNNHTPLRFQTLTHIHDHRSSEQR